MCVSEMNINKSNKQINRQKAIIAYRYFGCSNHEWIADSTE